MLEKLRQWLTSEKGYRFKNDLRGLFSAGAGIFLLIICGGLLFKLVVLHL